MSALINELLRNVDVERLTLWYINFQILLFVFYFSWYISPLIFRWFGLWINRRFVRNVLKNEGSLPDSRAKIELKLFNRSRWAIDSFNKFKVAWKEARLRGEDKAVIPIKLRDFLSRSVVVEGAINYRIAEAVPGIFVSFGILGTFLGLYLGLSGLKIDQLESLQTGVGQLISGISLAFQTSLLGIFFSVISLVLFKYLIKRVENTFLDIDSLLTRVYPFISIEHYSRKNIEVQEDIKQGMQTLATDIATKLSDAIEPAMGRAIGDRLVPIMENIQNAFRDHLEKNDQKQSEVMEHVLKQYVEQMSQTFQGQFKDMNQVIAETTKAQAEIKDQMVAFGAQMERQFKVQGELIEKTSHAGQILSNSLESLATIANELKSAADDISTAASLLENAANRAMEGQEKLSETMEKQIQSMIDTREELDNTWRIITENTNSVVSLIKEVIRELGDGVGNQLTGALEVFDSKLAEVTERFSGTLFETRETINDLPSFIAKLDGVFERIESDISEQKNAILELKETTAQTIKPDFEMIAHTSERMKEILTQFQQLAVDITQNIKKTGDFFSDEGPVKQAFTKINEKFELMHKQTTEKDAGLVSVFAKLNETLENVKDTVASNSDSEKYSPEFIDHIKNIHDSNLFIAKQVEQLRGQIEKSLVMMNNILPDASGASGGFAGNLFNHLKAISQTNEGLENKLGDIVAKFESFTSRSENKSSIFGRFIGK